MLPAKIARAAGSGSSVAVECCQICGNERLETVLSLGYMPPVNQMVPVGEVPRQLPWFPTTLLYCGTCELVQLGLAVDPAIVFPPEYPYTSGTTKLLRDNFADLYAESSKMLALGTDDLIVDIGSNDGTLIANFQKGGHRILGIEPTDVSKIANERGIPTLQRYFSLDVAQEVRAELRRRQSRHRRQLLCPYRRRACGRCRHLGIACSDGVFISELHYLIGLLDRLQYDTIYHEHLRYYSVRQPQAPAWHARPRNIPCPPYPQPRRINPGLCRAPRARAPCNRA